MSFECTDRAAFRLLSLSKWGLCVCAGKSARRKMCNKFYCLYCGVCVNGCLLSQHSIGADAERHGNLFIYFVGGIKVDCRAFSRYAWASISRIVIDSIPSFVWISSRQIAFLPFFHCCQLPYDKSQWKNKEMKKSDKKKFQTDERHWSLCGFCQNVIIFRQLNAIELKLKPLNFSIHFFAFSQCLASSL